MRAHGDRYELTAAEVAAFHRDGWVQLPQFLAEHELQPLEAIYMRCVRREIPVVGRDDGDMTGDYARAPEDYAIVNVMLPRVYHAALRGNVYERRSAHVAAQLLGDDVAIDYDQLVAKPP